MTDATVPSLPTVNISRRDVRIVDITMHARTMKWLWINYYVALLLLFFSVAPQLGETAALVLDWTLHSYAPRKRTIWTLLLLLISIAPVIVIVLSHRSLILVLSRRMHWALLAGFLGAMVLPLFCGHVEF